MALASFDLLAAIDLRGGRVVRLRQGDFEQETAYGDDPVAVAAAFARQGVRWLHVVDLDAARSGTRSHATEVGAIIDAVGDRVAVEVAGGLRTADAVGRAIGRGAARVVVGTTALMDPAFAPELVRSFGADRIAVAIDVRADQAVGDGWASTEPRAPGVAAVNVIQQLAAAGVTWFEVTAIERDGTLEGPDLALLRRAVAGAPDARIIASGGIASVDDILATRRLGCAGAIVGRAVYEGRLRLESALRATAS